MAASHQLYAQDSTRNARFTGTLAAGPNYYYNNIKTFGAYVRPFNFSIFGKIMWHSKYMVSLGVETGYNKFYNVKGNDQDPIRASLAAIPLHLVIGMNIRSLYAHFSFGPSLLLNSASSIAPGNSAHNKVWSLADGSLSAGYRKRLNTHFIIGAALKFNFSSKASDINWALPVSISYDF
jgi:hypothetical protein